MFELKKISPLSLAKVQTLFMAVFGLFVGLLYAGLGKILSGLPEEVQSQAGLTPEVSAIFGPWAILIMPITYAIIGFITGLIGAWIYNVIAKQIGGIKVELSK
jgi:hypothetical protein